MGFAFHLISSYRPDGYYYFNRSFQLFGGGLVSFENIDDWISWVRYLSFGKYGVEVSKQLIF